jgi:hypothetical protein
MKGKKFMHLLWSLDDEGYILEVFENEKTEDYISTKWTQI